MKISGTVEKIVAQAIALDQNGGLKNTIFAIDENVYILNYDHTILLNFTIRKTEKPFGIPISFRANDYDSNEFFEKDGKIVFRSASDGFIRTKSCVVPEITPIEMQELFNKYWTENNKYYTLSDKLLPMLDRELSHLEFSGQLGQSLILTQRNIYSGSLIHIQKNDEGFMKEELHKEIEPIAVKIKDFIALYNFLKEVKFSFDHKDYIQVSSVNKTKMDMKGIIACCIYDELLEIRRARHGGQE